ncbi:hypothetical protein HaLaN_14453 [Haematococcus lacustris]|uniref:Uncharacterized protein n=1 Tax=Haematococcus lacustris TaxID=44745 RepID=A0A699Z549_HAELA|nr:hypothetical protein HaLaN_14453 [Haematococcus lacustris]
MTWVQAGAMQTTQRHPGWERPPLPMAIPPPMARSKQWIRPSLPHSYSAGRCSPGPPTPGLTAVLPGVWCESHHRHPGAALRPGRPCRPVRVHPEEGGCRCPTTDHGHWQRPAERGCTLPGAAAQAPAAEWRLLPRRRGAGSGCVATSAPGGASRLR